MPEENPARLRRVADSYESQLLAARRLARFRVMRRMAAEKLSGPGTGRRELAKKIAKEMFDALVYTGNTGPVAEDIRKELGNKLGGDVRFAYPPGETLHLVLHGEGGPRSLPETEQQAAMNALWEVTLREVARYILPSGPAS